MAWTKNINQDLEKLLTKIVELVQHAHIKKTEDAAKRLHVAALALIHHDTLKHQHEDKEKLLADGKKLRDDAVQKMKEKWAGTNLK